LDEALDGISHVCATAMTPRDFGPPTRHPRAHLAGLAVQTPAPTGVAFLLGSERFGMRNEDVYKAHVCLQIPTTTDFGSLNLGAAVQVLAYEWRMALGGFAPSPSPVEADAVQPADAASVAGMLKHWEEALVAVGFLDPQAPKKLMPRLQQLFNRAAPTAEEIHILRGIAKSMSQAAQAKNEGRR
jgi:tRNA/rRNA methyltransferase